MREAQLGRAHLYHVRGMDIYTLRRIWKRPHRSEAAIRNGRAATYKSLTTKDNWARLKGVP